MYLHKKVRKNSKQILNDAFKLYLQTFIVVMPISLLVAIFSSLSFFEFYTNEAKQIIWHKQGLWVLYELLIVIISAYAISIIYSIMHHSALGQPISLNDCITLTFSKAFKLAIATVFYVLILAIGIPLLVFPGAFFAVLLIHYMPLILFDNRSVLGSFKTSAQLVWKHWWHCFVPILIPVLYILLLLNIKGQLYPDTATWIDYVVKIIAFTLSFPYLFASITVLLNDLIHRKQQKEALEYFKESQT